MPEEQLLIVDDSKLSRMLIKGFALASKPSWQIIEAADGDEALSKTDQAKVSWMTIDYNMPGMDGLTLASRLKQRFPQAKIALLTANIQDSIKNEAEALGISFIQKPITEDKIKAYVEQEG